MFLFNPFMVFAQQLGIPGKAQEEPCGRSIKRRVLRRRLHTSFDWKSPRQAYPASVNLTTPRQGLRMLYLILLALLCASVCTDAGSVRSSSYSGEYGGGGGKRFSHSGNQLDGPITALRIRANRYYITGLQVRYGTSWSNYVGGKLGDLEEVFLHPGEHIIQVQGKYSWYLRRLNFITNKGRQFPFGKDTGTSFNAAPLFQNTVLRYISGSSGAVIDAIGFHWDTHNSNCVHCN